MTIEEKIKFIKESKEKNYLYILTRVIQGGATLVGNYETLELYEKFSEKNWSVSSDQFFLMYFYSFSFFNHFINFII
jgi:hypothetical protein